MRLNDVLDWQTNTKDVQTGLKEDANLLEALGAPYCLVWMFNIDDGRAAAAPSAAS
jgi:hypothetical protein